MASVKIPGYRHHFADEFNEEYNHQNAKKTRGRLKINIEVSFVLKLEISATSIRYGPYHTHHIIYSVLLFSLFKIDTKGV